MYRIPLNRSKSILLAGFLILAIGLNSQLTQLTFSVSNEDHPKWKHNEGKISFYLDSAEIAYEKICIEAGKESWDFYTGEKQKSENKYRTQFSELLLNNTLQQNIGSWIQDTAFLKNDTLKRRLCIWQNMITWAKVDLSPEVIELQNELEIQLANDLTDGHKKAKIEKGIKNLIHLRNQKAKQLGCSNYAYLMLQNTGIDTIWFNQLIQTIYHKTQPAYNKLLSQIKQNRNIDTIKWSDIRKYVIESNRLNKLPDITKEKKEYLLHETLEKIGLDIRDMPVQILIKDLPPGLGGLGIAIDIPNNFKTVMRSDLEFRYMLHEIGHGLHWTNVTIKHPILKGYDYCANPTLLNGEAMAEIIGNFSRNNYWMIQNGYSASLMDSINNLSNTVVPVWLRLQLIKSLYEIELYKNPERSAAEIKTSLYKKYLNIDFDFSKFDNLISMTYVSYPVYEQNYLIADIISWQIHDYLFQKFGAGYVNNKEVGVFLKDYLWKDGEFYSWRNKLTNVTGNDIDIDGYLRSKNLITNE